MENVEKIHEKRTDGNKNPNGNEIDIQRRSSLDTKQMFGDDGKNKKIPNYQKN